jgi:amino acid transporter
MFSIDAPLKMMLLDADTKYVPKALTVTNKHGAPINGYYLTLVLVAILIIVPVFGIGDMTKLFNWLLNLNSIVMPMRYMWVFFAYVLLRSVLGDKQHGGEPHYQFLKNRVIASGFGWWCFALTAFVCIMGAIPKSSAYTTDAEFAFQLTLNILAPVIFIVLGFILPVIARRK